MARYSMLQCWLIYKLEEPSVLKPSLVMAVKFRRCANTACGFAYRAFVSVLFVRLVLNLTFLPALKLTWPRPATYLSIYIINATIT